MKIIFVIVFVVVFVVVTVIVAVFAIFRVILLFVVVIFVFFGGRGCDFYVHVHFSKHFISEFAYVHVERYCTIYLDTCMSHTRYPYLCE